MWFFLPDRLVYVDDTPVNQIPFLVPDFSSFEGEIIRIPAYDGKYIGYDDWTSHFSRQDEIDLVKKAISDIASDPTKRIHIAGISTLESADLIRDYYRDCGYEDELAKNYTLPADVRLTVSVSLSHILWCEKDKNFLTSYVGEKENRKRKTMENIYLDTSMSPLYALTPPVRSPADLRVLQQAVRMGILMGIELSESEKPFLAQVFEKQICSLFELSQMLYFRWGKYGFTGRQDFLSLRLPAFSAEGESDF